MQYANNKCTITDQWKYNDMRVVWMENDLVKIGVLVGRGADIFEFRYKRFDQNFLLRLPGEIKNPASIFTQKRDTGSQMEDYYYGGWQDCLPNSAPFTYRGASYGQHGEVWGITWQYSIIEDSADQVTLKCWVRPMRTPLLVEKYLTLKKDSSALTVKSRVTNEGGTHFDMIWGQHIAFGLPFIKDEMEIEVNATFLEAEEQMPEKRRFKPGIKNDWPMAMHIDGKLAPADQVEAAGVNNYSDLAYLSGFGDKGQYSITNHAQGLGFGVEWDARLFKYLWYWLERNGLKSFPWWGNTYTVALEPWTTKWTDDPLSAIENGEWERIESQEYIETEIVAYAIDKN